MTIEWTCGEHHDSIPPFATLVAAAECLGGRSGRCDRPIVMVFVALDDGDGTQPIPPLCLTGACAKHRPHIRQMARSLSVGWLGFSEIPLSEVAELIGWFHGRSGLCKGDRALALLSPRPPVASAPD